MLKASLCVLSLIVAFEVHSSTTSWSQPIPVASGPAQITPAKTPVILDSNSNALVGWLNGDIGVGHTLFTALLRTGTISWETPQVLYNTTDPNFPIFPSLFFNENLKQIAGFDSFVAPSTIMLHVSQRNSYETAWPAPISTALLGFPQAGGGGADELGNIFSIQALETGVNTYLIDFLTLPAGATAFTSQIPLGIDNDPTTPVTVASINLGTAVMAWKISTPQLQFKSARYFFNGEDLVYANDIALPNGTTDIAAANIETDRFGNSVLLFTVLRSGSSQVYYALLPEGSQTWSTPVLLSDPAFDSHSYSLKLDRCGNAVMLYAQGHFTGTSVEDVTYFGANLPKGCSATNKTPLNMIPGTIPDTSALIISNLWVDSFGNAAALINLNYGNNPTVQVVSKPCGKDWALPVTLSTHGINGQVTLNDQGTAVAVWLDSNTKQLFSAVNPTLFPITMCSFVAKQIKERFLTQSIDEVRLEWTPSPAPNILYYEIRNGDALIATVPGSGPFVYCDRCSRCKGPYTLTAVASNGNRSDPIRAQCIRCCK